MNIIRRVVLCSILSVRYLETTVFTSWCHNDFLVCFYVGLLATEREAQFLEPNGEGHFRRRTEEHSQSLTSHVQPRYVTGTCRSGHVRRI